MLHPLSKFQKMGSTFWEERGRDPQTPVVWRFRLEDPRTERRRGFGTFEEMMAFLRSELDNSQISGDTADTETVC